MVCWPSDIGREVHAVLDSTSAEAMRRAAAGEAGPVWILAKHQTAARGRRGRGWASMPGNFAASLLCRPKGDLGSFALRSFAAALGLHDGLSAVSGNPGLFALKWPNDVLLSGRKVAGILLETATPRAGPPALVIGIGVNLRTAPDAARLEPGAVAPASLFAETGREIAPEAFLDCLAPCIAHWESRLDAEGFAPLRAAWLARAARLGRPVAARLPGREVRGIFETLDETGALVLRTAEGRRVLPAADLHFPPTAPEVAADAARH